MPSDQCDKIKQVNDEIESLHNVLRNVMRQVDENYYSNIDMLQPTLEKASAKIDDKIDLFRQYWPKRTARLLDGAARVTSAKDAAQSSDKTSDAQEAARAATSLDKLKTDLIRSWETACDYNDSVGFSKDGS